MDTKHLRGEGWGIRCVLVFFLSFPFWWRYWKLQDFYCCLIDPVRLVSALCSSLDNYSDLSSKLRYLQRNNCTWLWISQARYNNTPLVSFSAYLLYFFCHYQLMSCSWFVFWLSVFAICFTENNVWLLTLIIINEISNASYSEWCGQFFGLWWFTVVFVTFALQFYTSK